MNPPSQKGEILYSRIQALQQPYELGDDPRGLQLVFSRLFDDCALAVHRAGSDLDEVIVERFVVVRDGQGVEHEMAASFLAEPSRLKKEVLLAVSLEERSEERVRITAVKLVAFRDSRL